KVSTPWGDCLLASLDPDRRVIFANRHLCTQLDNGQVNYAPPHEVNYRALVWALVVESQCQAVVSLSSTGTLHPEEIPVGSMLSAEDYYMVTPQATTFWGHKQIGSFEPPDRGDSVGRSVELARSVRGGCGGGGGGFVVLSLIVGA
ncbi:Probable S-methyl-5'-thioinosine phosphorylase (5'-methylthioinosine phosphorylase) (MTI phosphorylase) (MTIP), partial [Durusdinium trenchii]